jgi:hypothetical protein
MYEDIHRGIAKLTGVFVQIFISNAPKNIVPEEECQAERFCYHLCLYIVTCMSVTIRRGADKSLAFPISYFPICSTTKRIFLGRVKEVRSMKS